MRSSLAEHELRFGRVRARFRELCGHDALLASGVDTRTALRLLDGLLVADAACWPGPGAADQLTICERDRLLAAVQIATLGPRIRGSARCAACEERYDTEFRLDALVGALWPEPPPIDLTLSGGWRLRVPTGADELAVVGLSPEAAVEAMIQRCVLERGLPEAGAGLAGELAGRLEREAPVLDLALDAVCPECGCAGKLDFRVQVWLLRALMAERAALSGQLHSLARAYGWSASEILGLPRTLRLELVRLAEPTRVAARAA